MRVEVVKPAGFCRGVKRAIHLVKETSNKYGRIYCLGELIHNEAVIEALKSKGLKIINDLKKLDEINDTALIIRTHGITPEVYEGLSRLNLKIVDATCPIVKKIQNLCQKFASLGYQILIFGNEDHEEVKSLKGFSDGRAVVISEEEDLNGISLNEPSILISQSTKDEKKLLQLHELLSKRGLKNLDFYNTICNDIKTRQKRVASLAERVDLVLILGSKKSANANNLYKIAKSRCPDSYLISEVDELPIKIIKSAEKIGIATGASTSYNFLNLILQELKKL